MDAITAASRTAPLNIESLDDPVVTDSCPGFGGGQVSYGAADVLQPTQARLLVNVDIKDATATTRRGTTSLGNPNGLVTDIQGLAWFSTPSFAYMVAVSNGHLYEWNETSWTEFSAYTAVNATGQVCFAQLVNNLFITDGSSHLFMWDGTTLTDLGTGSATQPPVAQFLISDGFRLWAGNLAGVPDGLACSNLLDGTTWSSEFFQIRVGSGDGDYITGLIAWVNNQIVVFKRSSIWIVTADPSTTGDGIDGPGLGNATVQKVSDTIGCVSHRSIAIVGNDVWFLSDFGILSVGRVLAQNLQGQVNPPITLPVQDIIDRINWSYASAAAAVFWNNRYLLSLPLDSDTSPSTVLVYHILQGGFSGTWTNWGPLCWVLSKFGGLERLNFGRADGYVWRWLDYVQLLEETLTDYQDAGSAIATAVTTRAMILNDAFYPKSPLNISTEHVLSTAAATLSIALDEGSPQTVATNYSTNPNALLIPFYLPQTLPADGVVRQPFSIQQYGPFRSLQAMLTTAAGKLVCRAILATGFSDTLTID